MDASIRAVLSNPTYRPILAILKGFRNGAVYGVKIRFPHALVMTFLFKSGSLAEKLKAILRATFQHSKNLASFVFIYKLLRRLMEVGTGGKAEEYHAFVAAFVGGYFVFGNQNPVTEQINLYLLSRILMGLCRYATSKGYIPQPKRDVFPIFAAIVWGVVLWLFEYHQPTLQNSLQSSMTYLYHDSNTWSNIWDFLFYNNDRTW